MSVTSLMLVSRGGGPLLSAAFWSVTGGMIEEGAPSACGRKCQGERERLSIYFSVVLKLLLAMGGCTCASLRLTLTRSISTMRDTCLLSHSFIVGCFSEGASGASV